MEYKFDLALWFKCQGMAVAPSCVKDMESVEQVLADYVTTQYPSPASHRGMQEVAKILFEHPNAVFVTDKVTFDNAFVFAEKSRLHLEVVKMDYGQHQTILQSRLDYLSETSNGFMLVRALYADEHEMRVMYAEITTRLIPLEIHIRKFTIDQFLEAN